MSPQRKTTPATEPDASEMPSGSHADIEQLRERIECERDLVERLAASGATGQPGGRALLDEARTRYENAVHAVCDQLADALEESVDQNERLRKRNHELESENDDLKYRNAKLRLELNRAMGIKSSSGGAGADNAENAAGQNETKGGENANASSDGKKKPKGKNKGKRGAPKGHRGATRPVPETVDREEVVPPPDTCTCGCCEIAPLTDFDERYIEDIPPVSREVLRRIHLHGRCGNCGRTVRHPDVLASPPVTIGPNLAAHLTVMNQAGATFRKLAAFSTHIFGIGLTPAGALGLVNRAAAALEAPYNRIAFHLRDCDWLNGDETGWKIAGRNGYIWCFCNQSVAYFHHDFSRGARVIEDILGKKFGGIVICDFYAAYNCIDSTQRCLVHLLRDIKKEREILSGSKLLQRFEQDVRDFIERGLEVQAMPEGPEKQNAVQELEKQLDRLARATVTKGKAETLVKRIDKYRDDLIRFVTHPGVEFHNNRAERQLRPMVVNRKVCFGSSTQKGARRYCVIHTIVETCKLQNIEPSDFIRSAIVSGGIDVPPLTGTDPPTPT